MLQTHTLFPDAERGLLFQELVHGAGHDAAQDAGDEELSHALDTNQQHNEHQGVGSALNGHQVLDIVAVVERQHDIACDDLFVLAEDWDAELLLSIVTRAEGLCVQ